MNKDKIKKYFDESAIDRKKWLACNKYYHDDLKKFLRFVVPAHVSILEIGCGTGNITAFLSGDNKKIKGIDISEEMIKIAKMDNPNIDYVVMDAENLSLEESYDYILMSDVIGFFNDIFSTFNGLRKIVNPKSRVAITYYNFLWQPILKVGEKLGLKMPEPMENWLSRADVENLLHICGFEVVKKGERLLFPKRIPLLSNFLNTYLAKLPVLRNLCLVYYIIARPMPHLFEKRSDCKVSVIIPARNERGNIENAVAKLPDIGSHTEIIFVDGHSKDDTLKEMNRVKEKYKDKDIKIFVQEGKGKGDAVRLGFDNAIGDILMILDADLTVAPEDLEKFYNVLKNGVADFVNGCRLVYPMDKEAMRTLNLAGNKFFSIMFSWLLDQRIRDTLCGTKVLWKADYEKIKQSRKFFGEFDPFGDFDLLFGAAKLNMKIVDLPIRYKERTYGTTNISRFKHGWLLLKMCVFAMKKIKFV